MQPAPPLAETIEQILREQEPNFLRLYLNPHVAQTCLCLDRYVRTTWTAPLAEARGRARGDEDFQSFLANGIEEAISGALKLVRYNRRPTEPPPTALILDPAERLAGFASAELAGGMTVPFLSNISVLGRDRGGASLAASTASRIDPLVLVAAGGRLHDEHAESIRELIGRHAPRLITCVDRAALAALRADPGCFLRAIVPDVVVFDESFVDRAVPFAAFTARRSLFAAWNRPGKSTFHSTTFQPNTISTRHFMNCLARADPEFYDRHAAEIRALLDVPARRVDAFRRHYSPPLARLIRATGFETADVRAAGPFVIVGGQPIFDVVGGVACSVRGHNPPTYADETMSSSTPGGPDLEVELADRLRRLTGLGHFVPAVSGASAVENALKLALVARYPRRHVLALKAGFGGKTLFALTGTANPSYKERLGPLYAHVHYVDPFAPDATSRIDALLEAHEFAVVLVELIQSVGGVRPIPDAVLRHLDKSRERAGYLLVVDEVQTGMYRTGPFVRARALGLNPDVLLLGKGTSDMMFPFALTLYSDAVAALLTERGSTLTEAIKRRLDHEQGYRTVVNLLRLGEQRDLTRQVEDAARQFGRLLAEGLSAHRNVRDVRVFGLLIGIELDTPRWPRRWLGKRLAALYLLAMLRHPRFPVLAGFCQYEPNVLKITPPLDASADEIREACRTIVEVLDYPLAKLLVAGLGSLFKPLSMGKRNDEHANDPAPELVAR
jgi:acetylornithine/succinyldiaminopimelate/putrescine aminotransferase